LNNNNKEFSMSTRTSYAAALYIDIEAYGIWADGWNQSHLWPIILDEIHDEAILEEDDRYFAVFPPGGN